MTVMSICCCPWRASSRASVAFSNRSYSQSRGSSDKKESGIAELIDYSNVSENSQGDNDNVENPSGEQDKNFQVVADVTNPISQATSSDPSSTMDDWDVIVEEIIEAMDEEQEILQEKPVPTLDPCLEDLFIRQEARLDKRRDFFEHFDERYREFERQYGQHGGTVTVTTKSSSSTFVSSLKTITHPISESPEPEDETALNAQAESSEYAHIEVPTDHMPEIEPESSDEKVDENASKVASEPEISDEIAEENSDKPETEHETSDEKGEELSEILEAEAEKPDDQQEEKPALLAEQLKTELEDSDGKTEEDTSLTTGKPETEPEKSDEKATEDTALLEKKSTEEVATADLKTPSDEVPVTLRHKEKETENGEALPASPSKRLSKASLSSVESESISSVYSAAGTIGKYGVVPVSGQVQFSLNYDYQEGELQIHINQCKDLAPVDAKRNRSDPHIKVYLLPDKTKSGKRKTKTKRQTLNPVFDEEFKYKSTLAELDARTLWLTVWHIDKLGHNIFLGEITLPLDVMTLKMNQPTWHPLTDRMEPSEYLPSDQGQLVLAVRYVPPDVTSAAADAAIKGGEASASSGASKVTQEGSVHLLIKQARNLTSMHATFTSDPFCKCYLLPDKSKASKRKTPVIKNTVNPTWNHTFVYDYVTAEDLKTRCAELTVWEYDAFTSNVFLGGARLGLGPKTAESEDEEASPPWMDSQGEEARIWKEMIEKPNQWIEGIVTLRPSMYVLVHGH